MMDELKLFEQTLLGDVLPSEIKIISDIGCALKINQLPSIRPFLIDKATQLCFQFCKNDEFRKTFLEKSVEMCPVLLHRMFKLNIFGFNEIEPFLRLNK